MKMYITEVLTHDRSVLAGPRVNAKSWRGARLRCLLASIRTICWVRLVGELQDEWPSHRTQGGER